jgi:hypothetical protein
MDREKGFAVTDSVQAARQELAFLKAVAEDRGPLPRWFGAHLFAVGAIFGLNLLVASAMAQAGVIAWTSSWTWLPSSVLYVPVWFIIHSRSNYAGMGPSARVFAAAWLAVMSMTFVIVACLVTAGSLTGVPYVLVWPAIACALYGGAWLVISVIRRQAWMWLVTAGCFVTALACAITIGQPGMLVALGVGLLAVFAAPGFVLMRKPKTHG